MKSSFHIWGAENDRIKNTYSELNCEICLSNVTLPKRGHYKHIKTFCVFERVQIDLTQISFENEDILSRNGYKWVLTIIDCFSKLHGHIHSNQKSLNLFVIYLWVVPKEEVLVLLQSDNGEEFVSNIIKNVMPKLASN